MNVFFLDPQHVNVDAWKYIAKVCNISKVFVFSNVTWYPGAKKDITGWFNGLNHFVDCIFQNKAEDRRFCNNIANYIARIMLTWGWNDGSEEGEWEEYRFDSRKNDPVGNMSTNDPNILVLCEISQSLNAGIYKHSSLVGFIDYFISKKKGYMYLNVEDYIRMQTAKVLQKKLGYKCEERVCYLLIDSVVNNESILGEDYIEDSDDNYSFISWLCSELHYSFPEQFTDCECISSVYDMDSLSIARENYEKECDDAKREYKLQEIRDAEWEDERRMNNNHYYGSYASDEAGYNDNDIDNAFDGDPDAYWNID